jgi:glycosyltransferase involved in cell wall biosynthesis
MELLYVVSRFPKISESFILNEIHELHERGHEVSVFSFARPEDDFYHTEVENVDVTVGYANRPSLGILPGFFSGKILNASVLREGLFLDRPLYSAYWLHVGKQIAEMIERLGGVDLVHSHFAVPSRISAVYAAAYHDIPCTVTAHAYDIFRTNDTRQLKRVCSRFDHVVVPAEYNRRYLADEVGIGTEISVVPATTRVDKFEPSGECVPGRLLTVARLIEKKGHQYAIDAVADLVDRGYDVEYHLVGTGEREDDLRARVERHGIVDHVEFLGNVSDERLIEEFHDAAIFVLPCVIAADGDRDITPVALREAMATRTACVSTNITAIPEVITHGQDGVLVEPNDAEALAGAIAGLLDDPRRREELAGNARETMERRFDISNAVDRLVEIFNMLEKR